MTLKLGWIGCGTHATQMLLAQWLRLDAQIAALCDTDPERLQRAGRQFGVTCLTTDANELLATPGLDAIGMAVGPQQHLEFGLKALQRGLGVFVEKPPASDASGARQLLAASEKSGKPVVVGFMKRYSVGNKIAKNVLQSGRFGRVLGLTGTYMTAPGYFAGNVDYSGFFLHHCVHYMDLAAHLVSPIKTLSARKVEASPGRVLFHVALDFDCGAVGTIVMGTVQSRGAPCERIELMGDHTRLEIDDVVQVKFHRNPPFKTDDAAATLADEVDTLTWTPNFTAAANEDHKGYLALLSDAVTTLKGGTSPAPTIADGVVAMQWLERLRTSLQL
jgi:myo-inositol 2-dehydrogenase/D-chiro-inositol 1-dehydrogenase